MRAITLSEARENLKAVIDQVVSDSAPTMIVRRKGQEGAVLISASEWASIEETLHSGRPPTPRRCWRASPSSMRARASSAT